MADEDSEIVYNVSTKGYKYVVLGDGNTINITEQKERVDVFAEALENLPKVSALPAKPFHKCLKREREVQMLSRLFKSNEEKQSGVPHLTTVYVTGPPGSGKTQLARQFGEHFLEAMQTEEDCNCPPVVITFNAESAKSLLNSLKEFLELLKLIEEINQIHKESDETKVAEVFVGKLQQLLRNYPGRWLIIFDNMSKNDLGKLLPEAGSKNWGKGEIIVTTRNKDLAPASHQYAEELSLRHRLDESDALRLLHQISGIETDHFALTLVREEFDGYPLSLACAATYVKEMRIDRPLSNFSWEQYLDLYRRHGRKLPMTRLGSLSSSKHPSSSTTK